MDNVPRFTLNATETSCATVQRNSPLHLSRILYKSTLFMQNKPNVKSAQINVSSFITSKYVKVDTWWNQKNKPNQTQNKPNLVRRRRIPERSKWTENRLPKNPTTPCSGYIWFYSWRLL